jgi:hypothetical protein
MAIDWSRVTLKHVRQACELYDSGVAVPRRPARSTFLLMDNKSYPAKFIRGLAYRLATGVELDPNRDYSGGMETVRFFQALGLPTQHDQSPSPAKPTANPTSSLSAPNGEAPGLRREHREPQKRALAELLRCRYGTIEIEAQFPWLTVPRPDQMDETIGTIFHALQAMRNFSGFITPSKSLKCDFFLPGERLIVEYDERQHFTSQRAKALELYPPDLPLSLPIATIMWRCGRETVKYRWWRSNGLPRLPHPRTTRRHSLMTYPSAKSETLYWYFAVSRTLSRWFVARTSSTTRTVSRTNSGK